MNLFAGRGGPDIENRPVGPVGEEGWGESREQHGNTHYHVGAMAGTCVCLELIHGGAWQKPTQYCKAIIIH